MGEKIWYMSIFIETVYENLKSFDLHNIKSWKYMLTLNGIFEHSNFTNDNRWNANATNFNTIKWFKMCLKNNSTLLTYLVAEKRNSIVVVNEVVTFEGAFII